jgi:predicted enzyme related to lactoylglutathione lyase
MKPNIVWFDIPALDIDRAIRFYSAILDKPISKSQIGDGPTGFLPTPDGGQMGCICKVKDFQPSPNGVMIYFGVNGRLRDAVAAVSAHGGKVLQDVHSLGAHGFRAEVLDSEGNCIALHSTTDK